MTLEITLPGLNDTGSLTTQGINSTIEDKFTNYTAMQL